MDWKLKLKALLHDPPYKILNIKGHEEEAKSLFKLLIEENLKDEIVDLADGIASAHSRTVLKPNLPSDRIGKFEVESRVSINETRFIDIFSGEKSEIMSPDPEAVKSLFGKLGNLSFKEQNERAKLIFLFLWRFYLDIFPEIKYHPADSRAPNHSIYDHLVQTSAIISALPRPAFLIFTINPVQSFISKARKTSDLWAGSYMLSFLIWESMKPIVEEYGPDVIIYPNLLGQPLVDRWLYYDISFKDKFDIFKDENWYKSFIDNSHLEEKITIANIPNRFLAIIPYNKEFADKCEDAFKNRLKRLAKKVAEKVGVNLQDAIEAHLLSYFSVYWAMMPWSTESIIGIYRKDFKSSDEFEKACKEYERKYIFPIFEDYKALFKCKNDSFGSNSFEVVKEIVEHPYYKPPNVGSAYSLLLELTEKLLGARKSIRDFNKLEQKGEKCHLCGEFEALKVSIDNLAKLGKGVLKEGEKLCGVCLTKRLFPDIIREELNLGKEVKFPSTSEMASIGEKRRLKDEIKSRFSKSVEKIELPSSVSVPKLRNDLFYRIDGQFLMEETYRDDYFEKELGLRLDKEKIEEIKASLRSFGISPSRYYAILQMDGDNMGKWLKGEFNITIREAIHEKVWEALIKFSEGDDSKKMDKILCSRHPVSPSIHQAFSRRLSIFALEKARKIVEENHYGKLLYAGGDDILAFLPVEEALECGYDLQKEFKDILSEKASMSAGILIVHHKYPLYLALKRVNNAEKRAKNYYGKDSFCLVFMTHGGEERECGGKWDLVEFVKDLVCRFRNEEISSIFPYQYLRVVEELYEEKSDEKVREILRRELKRIFMRKEGGVGKDFLKRYFEDKVLPNFERMDVKNFANMLVIARCISGEARVW